MAQNEIKASGARTSLSGVVSPVRLVSAFDANSRASLSESQIGAAKFMPIFAVSSSGVSQGATGLECRRMAVSFRHVVLGYNFSQRHANLSAIDHNLAVYPLPLREFRCLIGYAVSNKFYSSRSVKILLSLGSPSAVLRSVWTIVVNSIQRVLGTGFFAHILSKVSETLPATLQPSVTNANTPSSVSIPPLGGFGVASNFHRLISVVQGVLFHDWKHCTQDAHNQGGL